MLPNQASSSRSNSSSDTKSFASGRSLARSFFVRRLGLLRDAGTGPEPGDASLFAGTNCSPAAMALFDRGSTLTLYGGSVFTRWIAAPSSSRSTSSGLLLSPQSSRWSPRIHRSPGCVIASSGGSGTSSGSVRPSCDIAVEQAAPVPPARSPAGPGRSPCPSGRPTRAAAARNPTRRCVAVWLSAMRYALICAGVRSVATWTGTCCQPELLRRLAAGVADDDHAVGVHDDRLAEPELLQRGGDGIHGGVVDRGGCSG